MAATGVLEALHGGEVTKLFSYGNCGFITSFLGEQVYFNSKSMPYGSKQLEIGEYVVFHLRTKHDEKKDKDTLYAADLLRASEM